MATLPVQSRENHKTSAREHEGRVIREVLADLTRAWDALLPDFPSLPWRRSRFAR